MITFFLVGCGTMCHVCSFVKLHYHGKDGKETNFKEKEQVVESIKTVFEESKIQVQF